MKSSSKIPILLNVSYYLTYYICRIMVRLNYPIIRKFLLTAHLKTLNRIKDKSSLEIAETAKQLGYVCSDLNLTELSVKYFITALSIYQNERNNDQAGLSDIYNELGSIAWKAGERAKAIKLYSQGIELELKSHGCDENRHRVARGYHNIGLILKEEGYVHFALGVYFKKAEIVWKKLDDKSNLSVLYSNISSALRIAKKHKEASGYAKEALKMSREVNKDDIDKIAFSLNEYGLCEYENKKYPESIKLFVEALEIYKSLYFEIDIRTANTYLYLGRSYKELNDSVNMEFSLTEAMKMYRILETNNGFGSSIQSNIILINKIRGE
jgi:tetratricopeptide (TPR) repeat protein